MTQLRVWLAAALCLASLGTAGAEPFWTPEARQRLLEGLASPAHPLALQRMKSAEEAERALARGDFATAQARLDDLALQLHSPDVELALVRTDMQAGEYRRALGFAAHAAGAHPEVTSGTALYAWLLHLGGQGAVANRTLTQALEAAQGDEILLLTRRAVSQAKPKAEPLLMMAPRRFAPYAYDLAPASSGEAPTEIVATGTLSADGRHAFVPLRALSGARRIFLRNGLGQTVAAELERSMNHPLIAVLKLGAALPAGRARGQVTAVPFAGGPAHMAEYADGTDASPAWPLLRSGFFGRFLLAPGDRLLGIEAAAGPRGGPVFDNAGRLAGVAVSGADQRDHLVSILELEALLNEGRAGSASPSPSATLTTQPLDALYETALCTALQVLVAR